MTLLDNAVTRLFWVKAADSIPVEEAGAAELPSGMLREKQQPPPPPLSFSPPKTHPSRSREKRRTVRQHGWRLSRGRVES